MNQTALIPKRRWMLATAVAILSGLTLHAAAKPLKVFILAGQLNRQGHAKVKTCSAKILGGVGKGFAEAMVPLVRKQ